MNRSIGRTILSLLLLGSSVAAQSTDHLSGTNIGLTVWLHDYAGVPDGLLEKATAEASRIYRQAGIEIRWLDCSFSPPDHLPDSDCEAEVTPTTLFLRILPESMAKDMKLRGSIFGLAVSGRRDEFPQVASIFYHRLFDFSEARGYQPGPILGSMLAHEIGHLLLGKGSHSRKGLMRCPWGKDQIKGAARGRLMLAPEESREVIAALRERTLTTQAGLNH